MYMHVARLPEHRIFEMVMLEIGNRMRHVRLSGQERLLPQDRTVAQDARRALDVERQVADQNLGTKGGVAQLRMRQIEVVHALGDMVGELVGEREADPERR